MSSRTRAPSPAVAAPERAVDAPTTAVDEAQSTLGNEAVQGKVAAAPPEDDGGGVLDAYLAGLTPDQRDREQKTMDWLGSKESTPDRVSEFEDQARAVTDGLTDAQWDAYADQGLNDDDLDAVAFYTSNAAYAINAVLRGQVHHPDWLDAFGSWSARAAAALPKLPRGATNSQGGELIDATKADDAHIDFDEVYRADDWSAHFTPMFLSDYRVGGVIQEPGFMSTTLVKGSYGADMAVQRVITNASSGKNISALSIFASENEALFAPGTRLKINSIVDADTGKRIANPSAVYKPEELETHKLDVEMAVLEVGGSGGKQPADRKSADAVPATDPLVAAATRASKV